MIVILIALGALVLLKAPPAAWLTVGAAFLASLAGIHV
jgi:hypothetical protein